MQVRRLLGTMIVASSVLVGCNNQNYTFAPVPNLNIGNAVDEGGRDWGGDVPDDTNNGGGLGQKTIATSDMRLGRSQATFKQSSYGTNDTSVSFRVVDSNGNSVNTLDSSSITVTENGVPVSGFTMTGRPQQTRQTVDIALLLDTTCTMRTSINSAKSKLIEFINNTRAAGYRTRMCLSTFGDRVVIRCNRFYDNNPADPSTMTQVNELIALISAQQAGCGAADPGGPTLDENPLGAIIAAETAPWAPGSQRFAVMMTDWSFVYSPGNDIGLEPAPKYTDALASMARSQMNLFLAAPSYPGYNQNFQGSPSLVQASGGEFFLYSDIVAGRTTFGTILDRIIARVQTTYTIGYTSDNIPGLNPSLPMNQRTIVITPKNGAPVTITIDNATSTMPDGRAQYASSWTLSDKQIETGSTVVKINNVVQTTGYSIVNGQVVFATPPPKGADITVEYQLSLIKDALSIKTVTFSGAVPLNRVAVFLNGIKAKTVDVYFERNLQNNWIMYMNSTVLAESDNFKIRQNGGLSVEVVEIE